MTPVLDLVQAHFLARIALGVALASLLALPVRLRYSALLRRQEIDLAGLAIYQRSGLWLAALTGFTATFLPTLILPVGGASIALVTGSSLLVGGLLRRSTP